MAFPFGGEGYIMIELHYDNPHEVEGKYNYITAIISDPNICITL